jgi:hypothetical protein
MLMDTFGCRWCRLRQIAIGRRRCALVRNVGHGKAPEARVMAPMIAGTGSLAPTLARDRLCSRHLKKTRIRPRHRANQRAQVGLIQLVDRCVGGSSTPKANICRDVPGDDGLRSADDAPRPARDRSGSIRRAKPFAFTNCNRRGRARISSCRTARERRQFRRVSGSEKTTHMITPERLRHQPQHQ